MRFLFTHNRRINYELVRTESTYRVCEIDSSTLRFDKGNFFATFVQLNTDGEKRDENCTRKSGFAVISRRRFANCVPFFAERYCGEESPNGRRRWWTDVPKTKKKRQETKKTNEFVTNRTKRKCCAKKKLTPIRLCSARKLAKIDAE